MKKITALVLALICAVFLSSCAAGQDEKTDVDRGSTGSLSLEKPAVSDDERTEDVQAEDVQIEDVQIEDVQAEDIRQEEVSDDGKGAGGQGDSTGQNGQDSLTFVPMRGLMQGSLGSIGSGFLAYTLPGQDGDDYKLCFFKEGGTVSEFENAISEVCYYSLETADYLFPDVRENNVSIGKFREIYFFGTITIGESGAEGLTVIAAYETDSGICYDTRLYSWNGTGYDAEEELMQELNEKYGDAEAYPVEELYRLVSVKRGC